MEMCRDSSRSWKYPLISGGLHIPKRVSTNLRHFWAAAHLCSNLMCPHLCFTLASAGFESSWMLRQCDHATHLFLPLVGDPSQRKKYMCFCFVCGRMAQKIFVGGFSNILEALLSDSTASGSWGFCLQQGFLPNCLHHSEAFLPISPSYWASAYGNEPELKKEMRSVATHPWTFHGPSTDL